MKQHLNTLFVTTDGAYLRKDGEAVAVRVDREVKLRVPLHHLGGIVCFGRIGASPQLMGACAEAGIAISFMTEHGRLRAVVRGMTPGNVLLRREQYRRADQDRPGPAGEPGGATQIARPIVVAKLLNSRVVLRRAVRDYPDAPGRDALETAARRLAQSADSAQGCNDLDQLRGIEGEAAADYFNAFPHLLRPPTAPAEAASAAGPDPPLHFTFTTRSRRPPRDPVNALLSFLYSMLTHDARAACEAAGLDPQVGFLHRDRPGRPSLALDLIEELRGFLADRLTLSLINRQQVSPDGFTRSSAGGVTMSDATRKTVLTAYQKRKQETLTHPYLQETVSVGLLVHLQARLLARHLRGDLDAYPPFLWK
jgi:CRISPR-associated protein Cas1